MDRMQIAGRLRKARGNRTVREVAYECGIAHSTLTMYETGQRVPKDEIKKKLAKCFNTSVEDLFFT